MITDIDNIKKVSKWMFDAFHIKEVEELKGLGIVCHPYTNSMAGMSLDNKLLDLRKSEDVNKFRESIFHIIDTSRNLSRLFIMLDKRFYLLWFYESCEYMSEEDYGKYLSTCWIQSENPNQDVNVSLNDCVGLFWDAMPEYLMDEEELEYFNNLPDFITVYRGVSPGRERNGLSWTNDKQMAEWFKSRFERDGKTGELLTARISKKHVLAYFNGRDEKELVVDVFAIEDEIKTV